ncbi:MAG: septal ring lytic transglycosylase RlpA family protein [Gammaproteobacteria bacterium]|nr:MAG: septal ring lytic transglycosylase RlpA family protein [Gammaproteobacteria bacterium]
MKLLQVFATLTLLALLLAGCSHQPPATPPAGSSPTPISTGPRPAVDAPPSRAEPTRAARGQPGVAEPPSARGNMAFYEVFGQRYRTLSSAEGYRERGVASWYGAKFHGLPTSSGEPYDMHAMTAAHRSLPLPTWVEVHHLHSGKRIVVRVNDRGPFVDNRIIDLSYAAARELDMVEDGTALVEVRTLRDPLDIDPIAIVYTPDGRRVRGAELHAAHRPARRTSSFSPVAVADAATATPPPDTGGEPLFLQVGAFAQRENAERLTARLAADGFPDTFILGDNSAAQPIYRVRIGPIADVASFDATVEELTRLGISDTRLVTD